MSRTMIQGRVVAGSAIFDPGVVVVENGVITDVREGTTGDDKVDAGAMLVIPALVDLHSDGLEREAQPRPGVELDLDFAVGAFEGKVRSAGIATMYHGVAFEENRTWMRSLAMAERSYRAIEARTTVQPAVDHRVLHRLDARDAVALDALAQRLPDRGALVSFEDHTLGQGQFRDVERLRSTMASTYPESTDLDAMIAEQIAEREAVAPQYERSLATLSEWALSGRIMMMGHDLVEPDQVAQFCDLGASIAEFPCTVEAAEAARERAMPIIAGAPNVLLGGSHSGNVAAEALVQLGLCDALASDYAPHALLAAALHLVGSGSIDLAGAVALITQGPARAVRLDDRGVLAPGMRGDVLIVDDGGQWPRMVASWRAGELMVS
ncbi:MAG: alpha-D-ribose 1-methylphosphonate 5-triphosphate diphosphatase [Acidimicrobiia bacterium]